MAERDQLFVSATILWLPPVKAQFHCDETPKELSRPLAHGADRSNFEMSQTCRSPDAALYAHKYCPPYMSHICVFISPLSDSYQLAFHLLYHGGRHASELGNARVVFYSRRKGRRKRTRESTNRLWCSATSMAAAPLHSCGRGRTSTSHTQITHNDERLVVSCTLSSLVWYSRFWLTANDACILGDCYIIFSFCSHDGAAQKARLFLFRWELSALSLQV
jgi:hypothetical protein